MKHLTILLTLIISSITLAQAQTQEQQQSGTLYIGENKDNTITTNDGKMRLTLNGMCFDFGGDNDESSVVVINDRITTSGKKAYYGFLGVGSPNFNHHAFMEIGANVLTQLDYSAYTPEEANALMFSSNKAVHITMNVGTLNVPLNRSRSLVLSTSFGFTCENYTFAGDYTMKFEDGMMRPVALEGKIKKSKLEASYFHVPVTLDWNINSSNFFISAGLTLDVLMNSRLKYKFPKTKIEDEVTLNPIQVGVTARIGWKRLYAFTNYSFIDMFKANTGPKARRLSAGMGIWF